MKMAWLHFNGKDTDIPKPYFLPLPLITKENAEKTPAAWGCWTRRFRECADTLHGRVQKVPRDNEPGCVRRVAGLDHADDVGRL